jgi:hypothetical protein
MKIIETGNIENNVLLKTIKADVVIAASGYESRSVNLVSQIDTASSLNFVVGFNNEINKFSRKKNDVFFKKKGFILYEDNGEKSKCIDEILNKIKEKRSQFSKTTILVDYSCMTRIWYARLIELLTNKIKISKDLTVIFSYSPSKFIDAPNNPAVNTNVEPIDGYNSLSLPSKPTAIILGLGYITIRAFGLNEFLDAEPFIFYNDMSYNSLFSKEVEKNNEDLLNKVKPENIFKYPLNDTKYTEILLSQLCKDLLPDYRIVLAPCGPKPFTLICLLISSQIEGIDVWRISAGEDTIASDKEAVNNDLIVHYITIKA